MRVCPLFELHDLLIDLNVTEYGTRNQSFRWLNQVNFMQSSVQSKLLETSSPILFSHRLQKPDPFPWVLGGFLKKDPWKELVGFFPLEKSTELPQLLSIGVIKTDRYKNGEPRTVYRDPDALYT